ncbi:MAG TPA: hypothetical protein VIY47_03645 [Ignavibacteriaceae bacterium]
MEQPCTTPQFEEKYKTIITVIDPDNYVDMMNWINSYSKNSVDIKIDTNEIDSFAVTFAFENSDDALVFKIKYSV